MKNKKLLWAIASVALVLSSVEIQAYEVENVQNSGTIQGQVTFSGVLPEPLRFAVKKNPEVCGQERSLIKVETHGELLTGAVVVLEGIEKGKPFSVQSFSGNAPGEGEFRYLGGNALGLQVKTKGCNFGPFTGVLAADEPVQFENRDSIKHTLQTFVSRDFSGRILRTVHNRDIQPGVEFDPMFSSEKLKGSQVVRVTCNRHDFMQNWFYVVKNPYFAFSDKEGHFQINRIPPGSYRLRVWHPILGLQEKAVEIAKGQELVANFTYQE